MNALTYAEENPVYNLMEGPCAQGCRLFDVYSKRGSFCCSALKKPDGTWRLFWSSTGSRGSKRKFASLADALDFMHERRVKRQRKAMQA